MLFYTKGDDADQTEILVHCTKASEADQAVSEVANGSTIQVLDFVELNKLAKSARTASAVLILQKLLEIRKEPDDGSFISAMERLLSLAAKSGRKIANGMSKPH